MTLEKKYILAATLLGSLFFWVTFPIGLLDEPESLYDIQGTQIKIVYLAYDGAKKQYSVKLLWHNQDSYYYQFGRLTKKRRHFTKLERKNIEILSKNDTNFYFCPSSDAEEIEESAVGEKRKIDRLLSDDRRQENNKNDEEELVEIPGRWDGDFDLFGDIFTI